MITLVFGWVGAKFVEGKDRWLLFTGVGVWTIIHKIGLETGKDALSPREVASIAPERIRCAH